MKEYFVNNSMNLINSKYNYDQDMLDRVKYGLEILYIITTKLGIIFIISIIFGTFKETISLFVFMFFIKIFSYGIHAKKSWQCYIVSLIIFIILPHMFIEINLTFFFKLIIGLLSILSMILYAPADTYKRPLINLIQRKKLKFISIFICIIYTIVSVKVNNVYICNSIILSMIVQSISINPITYKLFGLPYKNYKVYVKNGV